MRKHRFATKEAREAYTRAYKRHWNIKAREDADYREREWERQRERYAEMKRAEGKAVRKYGRLTEKVWRAKVLDYARQEANDNGKPVREILERMGMPAEQIRKMAL